jgi:hypothetical protein
MWAISVVLRQAALSDLTLVRRALVAGGMPSHDRKWHKADIKGHRLDVRSRG